MIPPSPTTTTITPLQLSHLLLLLLIANTSITTTHIIARCADIYDAKIRLLSALDI